MTASLSNIYENDEANKSIILSASDGQCVSNGEYFEESDISEKETHDSILTIPNGKPPGNITNLQQATSNAKSEDIEEYQKAQKFLVP